MLNKNESAIMEIVYNNSKEKKSCLLKGIDILLGISFKKRMNLDDMQRIINELELEDYFDVVVTEKEGEVIYIFNLHQKGEGFERELLQKKRAINFKIIMTVIGAIGAFAITMILKTLFGG